MSDKAEAISEEFISISESIAKLKELGVIRSHRVVTDFGEWIALQVLQGSRLRESTSRGEYDLQVDGQKYRIITHRRTKGSPNRSSDIGSGRNYDYLLIIVLSSTFRIRSVGKIPIDCVKDHTSGDSFNWSDIPDTDTLMNEVNKHDLLKKLTEL